MNPWAESRLSAHRVPHTTVPRDPPGPPPTSSYNPQLQGQQAHYYGGGWTHGICINMLIRIWIRPVAPVPNTANWQVPTPTEVSAAQVPTAAQAPTPSQAPTLATAAQAPTMTQVPTAAQEDLDNDSEMWNMYLDEVKEEDNRITDAWKEDASSILVFVSLNLLMSSPRVRLNDKLQDRSLLRNCWCIHHRILQEVVHRFW
jgi:hypothetical protein